MIKRMKWVGMMLASLLAVSSCQNEEVVQNQSGQGQAFTLTASKGIGSRTAVDGDKTVWSEGDKIYVSSKDGKVTGVLTLTDGADDVTGTFSGFVFGNPSQLAYSVYPAPTSGTTLDLSEVAGAHQLDAPMIGKINQDGDVDVQFNHACGVLYVNLPGSTGQDFTITATNGGTAINLAATANVAASSIKWNGEVPSLQFTSPETDIEVTGAKGGVMYIPYYTNEDNLTDVTFKVEDTALNTTAINLTQNNGPIGKIVQSNILTLTYDNGEYKATTVPEVEVTNGELTISADKLDENIEYINIPTVKDDNGQVADVESITLELPKVDEQGQTSTISFDEIAEGTTVTIKEDEDATEEYSIKELTIILPSADAPVEIYMPNTTVTIISADNNELVIDEIIVGTADDTFVVEENVYIKTLKVRKGNVEVKGRVDNIIRVDYEEGDEDIYVYIIGNGKVGSIGEGVKYANKANGEISTAEDLIAALNINEGDKVTITLNADIILSEAAIVKEGTNITLDLNGKTISNASGYAFENYANLTINGEGEISGLGGIRSHKGKITVNGGNFTCSSLWNGTPATYQHILKAVDTDVEINSGTFDATIGGTNNAMINVSEGSNVTINGGKFQNVEVGTVIPQFAPYMFTYEKDGKLIINDGTFYGGWRFNGETATTDIYGGNFTVSYDGQSFHANSTHALKIYGGTFSTNNGGKLNPSSYVAGGYKVVENAGVWTVEFAPVAKIGLDNYFTTLQKAVDAVQDGETITLVANETFTENNRYNNGGWWDGLGYSGDKSFTIDLGGKTISQNGALNDYLMWFKNVGTKDNVITIKNGTLDAGTTAFCALCTASSHENQLTINLENVTAYNNISNGSTVKIRAGSVLNVNSGTKIIGEDSYLGIENWNATVNIYDGAEIYMNGTSSYNGCLVGVGGNGTINVYGGYGKGVSGGLIAMTSGGTINVSGGEWIANTDGTYANDNKSVLVAQSDKQYNAGAGNAVVNVTGGTFKGGYNCYGNAVGDAQINISGGNFNNDPTTYLSDGCEAIKANGIWTVKVQPVVKIGETEYETLEAAVSAAQAGDEITLIKDVTLSSELELPAGIIFNGNGKQINGTIYAGGNLTFVGHTKVTSFSASYYNRVITIGEGACLEVTGGGRVTVGYGNTFNITGAVEDAKSADKTNIQPSLIIPGGISITGGNDAVFNVTDAYVVIGNTSSKNNAANGTFTLNFTNTIAEFTNQFTLSEPTSGKNPTFNMNIKNSVFTTATKLCVAAPNSNVVIDNSDVTLGTYFRNSGEFNLKNGSVLTGSTIQFGENGGNDGAINVDASTLTINASSEGHAFDGKHDKKDKPTGSITLTNGAKASVKYYKAMTITADETSTFTGTEVK